MVFNLKIELDKMAYDVMEAHGKWLDEQDKFGSIKYNYVRYLNVFNDLIKTGDLSALKKAHKLADKVLPWKISVCDVHVVEALKTKNIDIIKYVLKRCPGKIEQKVFLSSLDTTIEIVDLLIRRMPRISYECLCDTAKEANDDIKDYVFSHKKASFKNVKRVIETFLRSKEYSGYYDKICRMKKLRELSK